MISCVAQDFGGFDVNGAVWWVEPLPHARFRTVSYCCHLHVPRHAGQQMIFYQRFHHADCCPRYQGESDGGLTASNPLFELYQVPAPRFRKLKNLHTTHTSCQRLLALVTAVTTAGLLFPWPDFLSGFINQ